AGSPGIYRASPDGAPVVNVQSAPRPPDRDDDGVAVVDMGPLESPPLGGFHAVQPFRLFDSREGTAPKLGPASAFLMTATGAGPIPASGVRAVVLNVTGVFPSVATHLSLSPGISIPREDLPDGWLLEGFIIGETTSNVNLPAGSVVPNLVTVGLNDEGRFMVSNNAGYVDVVADVVGWYDAGPPTDPTAAPLDADAATARFAERLADRPAAAAGLERWVTSSAPTGPRTAADFAPVEAGAALHPLAPARILDTRAGLGAPKARIGANGKVDLQVTGAGGVPADGVSAVVLNVTGVFPTVPTHVTAWPAGTTKPLASNLNLVPGQTSANLVTVKVGATGAVSLGNHTGQVDLVADVVGWYDTGGGVGGHFADTPPTRLYDSRGEDLFPFPIVEPLAPGETRTIDLSGLDVFSSLGGGVPESAHTVVLNVTGIATAPTHLTVWPGGAVPATSSLNLAAGETRANLVIVEVGPDRTITIRNNSGSTHVIVDLFGWFTAPK
ncbi:MAG: hypothetical protein KDB36_17635, partial [Acidimicrobiales bacterium]|nr:hypothetical protein [Acidimicrobiales bacterium]